MDNGEQIIIIEIDETQHKDYTCTCEYNRLVDLSTDVGHRPIVCIRFNPDAYFDGETNITSCWKPNNSGILVIPRNKNNEWKMRLRTLEEQVKYWTNPENKTNELVEVIHLFYDEC